MRDLPELVSDLVQLSRDYVRQEAFGPARQLGRVAGFSLAAALLFGLGGVLLGVVGMRALARVLPEVWSWAAYVVSAVVLAGVAGGILWAGRR
ncbi:MAG: phage holin family protein [Actinomycetota bacterium]|nr:phage holin family protein [Actinomycetota bacterium]